MLQVSPTSSTSVSMMARLSRLNWDADNIRVPRSNIRGPLTRHLPSISYWRNRWSTSILHRRCTVGTGSPTDFAILVASIGTLASTTASTMRKTRRKEAPLSLTTCGRLVIRKFEADSRLPWMVSRFVRVANALGGSRNVSGPGAPGEAARGVRTVCGYRGATRRLRGDNHRMSSSGVARLEGDGEWTPYSSAHCRSSRSRRTRDRLRHRSRIRLQVPLHRGVRSE